MQQCSIDELQSRLARQTTTKALACTVAWRARALPIQRAYIEPTATRFALFSWQIPQKRLTPEVGTTPADRLLAEKQGPALACISRHFDGDRTDAQRPSKFTPSTVNGVLTRISHLHVHLPSARASLVEGLSQVRQRRSSGSDSSTEEDRPPKSSARPSSLRSWLPCTDARAAS